MIAALRALKMQQPRELVVAVPVASPDRLEQVKRECDEALCLIETSLLQAVGHFYLDFTAVEDDVVINSLNRFADRHHAVEHLS
jgi:predicted phosphoribosyltransferase